MEEIPSTSEFQFLTESWRHSDKIGYHSTGEICYENGWIDDFGFVTPKGRRAIEAYEKQNVDKPEDQFDDPDTGERIDVV